MRERTVAAMPCPACNSRWNQVIESYGDIDSAKIRRVRKCRACDICWDTEETFAENKNLRIRVHQRKLADQFRKQHG